LVAVTIGIAEQTLSMKMIILKLPLICVAI
jgi:hypothetical protein